MFRLLVRISQHIWRQVPLSTLPGGESPNYVLSSSVAYCMLIVDSQNERRESWFSNGQEYYESRKNSSSIISVPHVCSHQATVGEKLSHSCPYCEAVFATKVRLQKHKLWNHPDRASVEPRDEETKFQKNPIKFNTKKRWVRIKSTLHACYNYIADWLELSSCALWIQAHGEQSSLSGVLQGEKDPRGVHSLSERRAGPPEEWEKTAQPQPANAPVTANPGSVPAVAVSEHVIRCGWQWKRGRQPSPSFPRWRPRANATQWAYSVSFITCSHDVFSLYELTLCNIILLIQDGSRKHLKNSPESNHLYLEHLDWKVNFSKKLSSISPLVFVTIFISASFRCFTAFWKMDASNAKVRI